MAKSRKKMRPKDYIEWLNKQPFRMEIHDVELTLSRKVPIKLVDDDLDELHRLGFDNEMYVSHGHLTQRWRVVNWVYMDLGDRFLVQVDFNIWVQLPHTESVGKIVHQGYQIDTIKGGF